MSAGVDDSSAHSAGGAPNPHAAWLRAGQARQQAKHAEQGKTDAASAAAEREREYKRRYREEHREEIRAYRVKYEAENREEVTRKKREYARERARQKRVQEERRERQREREHARYVADPEGRRAQIERWREAHPEKNAEYSKRYYERHRSERLVESRLMARARQGNSGLRSGSAFYSRRHLVSNHRPSRPSTRAPPDPSRVAPTNDPSAVVTADIGSCMSPEISVTAGPLVAHQRRLMFELDPSPAASLAQLFERPLRVEPKLSCSRQPGLS